MDNRRKMDKSNRAKQFMPFDALTGFREALREKERIRIPKKELSKEILEDLNYKLCDVKLSDMLMVEHYDEEEYIKTTGIVNRIDMSIGIIKIVDKVIKFSDILSIEVLEKN